jgi:lipoprotein-releasing system permease protein
VYKIILGSRYLLKRRITYFAILAVALCVFIVVVVMTVLTGLVSDFKQANHGFTGDCVVGTESLVGFAYSEAFAQKLAQQDYVEAVSPAVQSFALLSPVWTQQGRGVQILGIDPVRHSRVTNFEQTLHYRKGEVGKVFEPMYDPNLPGCVLGIDLVLERGPKGHYTFGSSPMRVGLAITCFPLTARGALAKAASGLVNTKTFYFSDTTHTGLARTDNSLVYLPLEQAQLMCGMDRPEPRVSALYVKFKPDVSLQTGCDNVASLWQNFKQQQADAKYTYSLDTVTVQSWKQYRRGFVAAMEKEETMMIAMFSLVGITTVFIVFVVFYMIISHKSKDIGVLKSIGVSNANIMQLFMGFAFSVGFLGSVIGVLLGWLFLLNMNEIEGWLFEKFGFQLWDRTIYAIGDIPSQIEFGVLVTITLSAIITCLIGALVPSWQAARLSPVETLHVSRL